MKTRSVLNFVLMALSAFGFLTVYDTVRWALYSDSWMFTLNVGWWGTPSDALKSVLEVLAVILIARLSVWWVSEMRYDPPAGASEDAVGEPYSPWVKGILASLVFLICWLVADPFLYAIAKGGTRVFTPENWWNAMLGIRREEVLAVVPATALIIVMADVVRRNIITLAFSLLWEGFLWWLDQTPESSRTQQQ